MLGVISARTKVVVNVGDQLRFNPLPVHNPDYSWPTIYPSRAGQLCRVVQFIWKPVDWLDLKGRSPGLHCDTEKVVVRFENDSTNYAVPTVHLEALQPTVADTEKQLDFRPFAKPLQFYPDDMVAIDARNFDFTVWTVQSTLFDHENGEPSQLVLRRGELGKKQEVMREDISRLTLASGGYVRKLYENQPMQFPTPLDELLFFAQPGISRNFDGGGNRTPQEALALLDAEGGPDFAVVDSKLAQMTLIVALESKKMAAFTLLPRFAHHADRLEKVSRAYLQELAAEKKTAA